MENYILQLTTNPHDWLPESTFPYLELYCLYRCIYHILIDKWTSQLVAETVKLMNRAIQACNKKYLDGFSTFIANVVPLCFRLVRCAHGGELRFMDDTRHLAASTLYKEERWQSFCRRKGWGKQHVKSHNFQKLSTLHDWNRVAEIYVM